MTRAGSFVIRSLRCLSRFGGNITLLTRFLRLLRWGSYFVPGRVRARGKTASRGRARRARAALKFSEFDRGKADFKRAIGRDLQVPRSVKDAAPIYGGVAHLSLWKPKRATNWVIPRFEPGESQILNPRIASSIVMQTHPRFCIRSHGGDSLQPAHSAHPSNDASPPVSLGSSN